MSYATLDHLRSYLSQVPRTPATDTELTDILTRSTSWIDEVLGWSFFAADSNWSDVVASTKRVRSEQSVWLRPPPYQQGSITQITIVDETTPITDYEEDWTSGKFYLWREDGWQGYRYAITAKYGYGPAPEALVQLNLELSVNTWRSRDKGSFTEIVGDEGGAAVRYVGGLNNQQKALVHSIRRQYLEVFK